MLQFFRRSVMRWLVAFFLLGSLISLGTVAYLAFYYSRASLEAAALNQLATVNEIRKNQVLAYLKERMGDVRMLSVSGDVTWALKLMQAYHVTEGGEADEPFDTATKKYKDICEEIDPFFTNYLKAFGYQDVYLISGPHGHVMYSAEQGQDNGTNLRTGPHKDSGLARLWRKIRTNRRVCMEDFSEYSPKAMFSAFIGVPVFDEQKAVAAVMAAQISPDQIRSIMKEKEGMGRTYFLGDDRLTRGHSARGDGQAASGERTAPHRPSPSKGNSPIEMTDDHQGGKVLSSRSPLNLDQTLDTDFDWVIISEIDKADAFAPIRSLALKILLIGLVLTGFTCVGGYVVGKSIADPLKRLCGKVTLMADGDLTVSITPGRRLDEIGTLIDAFYYMLGTLRNQTREIVEGAQTIASSINQISATATQLAASSEETSTSVRQITATVDQIREIAYVANQKAEQVAHGADQAARIYDAGKRATGDAVSGMGRIREEMGSVAESIVRLSDQTRSIGEIIGAVNDLADQSNLLSVNASIEAAKAGEHGRGFAVVAQEVKSLADQSKAATNQVRSILNEIQRATGTAVMATERGSKAVEAGMHLTDQSGESIDRLSQSVTDSTQTAIQIAASSQEQLAGMDQLVQAMESIGDASAQNVEGARQLEAATKRLDELGQSLKQLALMFKT